MNNITTVDETLKYNWWALLLTPIIVWGVIGNSLVCIAVSVEKGLQNVTNYFLLSLAVVDLLVSGLVMPISIYIEFSNGIWSEGFISCLFHTYSDVILCTASIVHMSVISLDRYMGISNPLKTRNRSGFVVILKIAIVWMVTLMISSPVATLALLNPENILQISTNSKISGSANSSIPIGVAPGPRKATCQINNRYFMIYGSTLAFLIPLIIMLVTYIRTIQLLRQQALMCQDSPGGGLRRTMTKKRSKLVGGRSSESKEESGFPTSVESVRDEFSKRGFNKGTRVRMSVTSGDMSQAQRPSVVLSTPSKARRKSTSAFHRKLSGKNSGHSCPHVAALLSMHVKQTTDSSEIEEMMMNLEDEKDLTAKIESIRSRVKERTQVLVNFAKKNAAQEVANEQKATRVLGIVFACFFICWAPFFALNFTVAFCGDSCSQVPPLLSSCFLWLGYISSTLNPLIYTIFNHTFRKTFSNLIRCRQSFGGKKSRRARESAKASVFSNGSGNLRINGDTSRKPSHRPSYKPDSPLSDQTRESGVLVSRLSFDSSEGPISVAKVQDRLLNPPL